jgi:hypothetical protein
VIASGRGPWWPATVLLALSCLAFVRLLAIPMFEDEGSQLGWIVRIIDAGEWLAPLGDGKPLEAWPVVPLVRLGLPPLIAMRALHVLAGAIGSLLVYRIALRVVAWPAAFAAGVLYVVCPFVVYLQRFALSDGFLCLAALTVCLSFLRITEEARWPAVLCLAGGFVFGALAKLPVGFVLVITVPLALLLMPAASRRTLLRAPLCPRLLAAHVPVTLLALLVVVTAMVRVRRGQAPGFGLTDFAGVGLGAYRDIGATMGIARITLFGELSAQLSWPVILIAAVGLAVAAASSDWRLRWLIALAAMPMLAIGTLATFWYSRYLLFTVPPLIIAAVAGWSAASDWARRSGSRLVRGLARPALGAAAIVCLGVMGWQSARIVLEPLAAHWSPVDRFQYFEGWGSGYGYPEAAVFLLNSATAPQSVFALDGHSAYQLRSYLPRAWLNRVKTVYYGPAGEVLAGNRERLENLLRDGRAWILIPEPLLQRYLDGSFGEAYHADWRLVAAFDKPGARTRLALFEATGR